MGWDYPSMSKGAPLPPVGPLQAHLALYSACTGWYIKHREAMRLT